MWVLLTIAEDGEPTVVAVRAAKEDALAVARRLIDRMVDEDAAEEDEAYRAQLAADGDSVVQRLAADGVVTDWHDNVWYVQEPTR